MAHPLQELTEEWNNRFPPLRPEEMTEDQRRIWSLAPPLPQQRVTGPLDIVLHSPVLAEKSLILSNSVTRDSSVPAALREFVILVVARVTSAQYEWHVHYPKAVEEGISPELLEQLRLGRDPKPLDELTKAVYRFTVEVLQTHRVAAETYAAVTKHFSKRQIVDLILSIGAYTLTSYLLNVGGANVPEGTDLPLPPISTFPVR